jgi:3'-phosphoadenosine 5'-phosphosulfate sulfotransferase (PAPS reductase)/FAD synthetase
MKNRISSDSLRIRQTLPLNVKVRMTDIRIRNFINEYGTDGVYISFSGGKDSTVLMHLAKKYRLHAVFLDTWLEYPQVREFVRSFNDVEVIKPEMSMKEIIRQYGWCFPGKDVAEAIWYARKGSRWAINKLHGLDKNGNPQPYREQYKKWLPLYESDLEISSYCCIKQKEEPIAAYEKRTGRKPILALMAEESSRRREAYLRTGCNSFDSDRPVSKPMGFWTNQDVLQYIVENDLRIASPYGEIVEEGQIPGQISFTKPCGKLHCTGEQRTGCMFCPIGCHLNGFAKFKRLKESNRKLYDFCMEDLGERKLLQFIEKHYM